MSMEQGVKQALDSHGLLLDPFPGRPLGPSEHARVHL